MPRVLIADDVPAVRMIVRRSLIASGHTVVEALDGPAAYEIGVDGSIDLAIFDHLMPGIKGIDVLFKWREQGIQIPVMILSAVDDADTVVAALNGGAADYIRKPFDPAELIARVGRVLRVPPSSAPLAV
ncbi:MAG: response regulator transcription factor [Acidimicrobiia bacterium]|nr:response regulator transcription factor [Acidimicrobiia bacterium]